MLGSDACLIGTEWQHKERKWETAIVSWREREREREREGERGRKSERQAERKRGYQWRIIGIYFDLNPIEFPFPLFPCITNFHTIYLTLTYILSLSLPYSVSLCYYFSFSLSPHTVSPSLSPSLIERGESRDTIPRETWPDTWLLFLVQNPSVWNSVLLSQTITFPRSITLRFHGDNSVCIWIENKDGNVSH